MNSEHRGDNLSVAERCDLMADGYDSRKQEQGWYGPEVVFGLMFSFINPGESVLDIGIGTGLGSIMYHKAGLHVYGLDLSPRMLEVCQQKGFATELKKHDLMVAPYPFESGSMNHAVCVGVLNHFKNLTPVFVEAARILKDKGMFGFVVADCDSSEESDFHVEHENSPPSTMHRHNSEFIGSLLDENTFTLENSLEFPVLMHCEKNLPLRLKAYVARRKQRI